MNKEAQDLLERWYAKTESKTFIPSDPISIPHRFTLKQDIEIAGFFAAIMSWGNRTTIIRKADDLLRRMDYEPFDFVKNCSGSDLKRIEGFVHRTLNSTDVLYFMDFLKRHYAKHDSLEEAFFPVTDADMNAVEVGLNHFREKVFWAEYAPKRSRKHIAGPKSGSACKRLNMFLRWMVRKDENNIDFGLWMNISPSQLICPLDVHVHRKALELKLIEGKQSDWKSALSLTQQLRQLDPNDPVKFDYALFGMGVNGPH